MGRKNRRRKQRIEEAAARKALAEQALSQKQAAPSAICDRPDLAACLVNQHRRYFGCGQCDYFGAWRAVNATR